MDTGMGQREWLTALETKSAFERAGLKDGELVRILSWACLSRRLVATGFRQINYGDDFAVGGTREQFQGSHIWRFFHRAFADGTGFFGEHSTLTNVDWGYSQFDYRIERDGEDPRKSCDIECWINWARGEASCSFDSNDGGRIQDVWRSVLFDAPAVEALTLAIRNRPKARIGRNPIYDWPAFETEALRLIWDEGGFHENFRQADCERSMADWCSITWTRSPAESNIRTHVQTALQAYETEKAQI